MPNLEYLEVDGDADMSTIFDGSLSFTKIQTLRLTNRPKIHRTDQTLLRSLNDLRRLELKHIPAEGLLSDMTATPPVGRKRSISSLFTLSLNSSSASSPGNISCWPLLAEITLDTISADDVMHLCRFANLNRRVKTVHLSRHAKRHLSGSLLRNNDIVYAKEARNGKRKGSPDSGINDVEDWLRKLVEVKVFKHSPGMIDRETFPLQALC